MKDASDSSSDNAHYVDCIDCSVDYDSYQNSNIQIVEVTAAPNVVEQPAYYIDEYQVLLESRR